jgi:predicted transporter
VQIDQGKVVDVITKSIEFRQAILALLLGSAGFALTKAWTPEQHYPNRGVLKRLMPCLVCGAVAGAAMLYEQRRLVDTISRPGISIPAFVQHWLSYGEPVIDSFIVFTAFMLLLGLRK